MGKLTVFENVTLDGVMQGPARPDEDRREEFEYGGWAVSYMDAVMARIAGEGMAGEGSLLLGRRTYEDFYRVWPARTDGNPYTDKLNKTLKYVASNTLQEPLPWMDSRLLHGDIPQAVASLKAQPGNDMVVLGSGELVQTLMKHNLVDQFVLEIFPLTLGTGRRLFADGTIYTKFQLVDCQKSTTGVLIATYQPAESHD
jgi:dihydrofolate reductase